MIECFQRLICVLFYHAEKYFMMAFSLNEFVQHVNVYILYKI